MGDGSLDTPTGLAALVRDLRALGVAEGGVLVVHSAFSTLKPVEGGPQGLVEALREALGPDGTLMMPSWTADDDTPFDPATTPPAADLGIVPGLFWRRPDVVRSTHPMAWAATGPRAVEIVSGPLPVPPHGPGSPIARAWALDGQVLLLGVGHDANTSLHLAEIMAGVPYGVPNHCTVLQDGRPLRVDYRENDHCCLRFALVDDWLRDLGLQPEGQVGRAAARLVRIRDVIEVAVRELRAAPLQFLHPADAGCGDCDAARASVGGAAS